MSVLDAIHLGDNLTQRRAISLAATVGRFRPKALADALAGSIEAQREALAVLARDCTEAIESGEIFWALTGDARRNELNMLQVEIGLAIDELRKLFDALPLDAGDDYGVHLRKALLGELPPKPPANQSAAYYAALEFVGREGLGLAPRESRNRASELRREAAQVLARSDIDATIGPVFIGRTTQLRDLKTFAAIASGPLDQTPMLMVSGIGGSGKSSLIAKFVKSQRRNDNPQTVVLLDFDKPSLASLDPIELTNEYLRQLAIWRPTLEPELRDLRRDLVQDQRAWEERGVDGDFTRLFEARADRSFQILSRVNTLIDEERRQPPILLIMDTFEEIIVRGAPFVDAAVRWGESLNANRTEHHVGARVRVVVSGRVVPRPDDLAGHDVVFAEPVEVGDLTDIQARQVLEQRGIPADLATKLVSRYGANPLVLRLLGDFCEGLPKKAIRELATSSEGINKFDVEATKRILYGRILERIRDPEILALASPGLVVRRVTPDTIRSLLNVGNRLGELSDERARTLFSRLVRQVWLVTQEEQFVAVHRSDLRRLIVPLINPIDARDLHARAVRYYSDGKDTYLRRDIQADEARYHRLFIEPEAVLTDTALQGFAQTLGDIDEYPPQSRAYIQIARDRALTDAELSALPATQKAKYRRTMARRSSIAGERAPASHGSQAAGRYKPQLPDDSADLSVDAVHVMFALGKFSAVAKRRKSIVEDFLTRVQRTAGGGVIYEDFTTAPLWTLACACLVVPDVPSPIEEIRQALPSKLLRTAWLDKRLPINGNDMLDALKVLFEGVQAKRDSGPVERALLSLSETLKVRSTLECRRLDVLRVLQLLAAQGLELPQGEASVEFGLFSDLSREFAPDLWGRSTYEAASSDRIQVVRAHEILAATDAPSISHWRQIDKESAKLTVRIGLPELADNIANLGIVTPELYAPIRVALSSERIRKAIAREMPEHVRFWPKELRVASLSESSLSTFVQYADRAGMLGELITIAEKNGFSAQVAGLYRTYIARLKRRPRPPVRAKKSGSSHSPAPQKRKVKKTARKMIMRSR